MGKRSDFERIPKDFYRTFDRRAFFALDPHLRRGTRFLEPCAGAGDLVVGLEGLGHHCVQAFDLEPMAETVTQGDALELEDLPADAVIITNPPWKRKLLHPLIMHLSDLAPTWLLFDSDWAFTAQSAPYIGRCRKIVAVGRLKWIPGSDHDGKDNAAWYLFDARHSGGPAFHGRRAAL